MAYNVTDYLGCLSNISISLEGYMRFINNNTADIGLVPVSIPKRQYKYCKLKLNNEGAFVDASKLIEKIKASYHMENATNESIIELIKNIQNIKTLSELKSASQDLLPKFNIWLKEGPSRYPAAIDKIRKKYNHIARETATIKSRMNGDISEEKRKNYETALEALKKEAPVTYNEALESFYIRMFIAELRNDLKLLIAYSNESLITLPDSLLYLIAPSKIRLYIANSLYERAIKEEASEKDISVAKKYIKEYLETFDLSNVQPWMAEIISKLEDFMGNTRK